MPREKSGLLLAWSLIVIGAAVIVIALYGPEAKSAILRRNADENVPWNLTLVNPWNAVPEDYEVELLELSNGERIDERIYPSLQEMFDDARAEGVYPIVRAGYRTSEEQQQMMDDKIEAYENEGHAQFAAEQLAKHYVAEVGHSEHQLGLAVDINADKEKCTNEVVYEWLEEHAPEYGFILRYPEGEEKVTGTSYEPWHYRYVGKEAAEVIYENNLCLEEFAD